MTELITLWLIASLIAGPFIGKRLKRNASQWLDGLDAKHGEC